MIIREPSTPGFWGLAKNIFYKFCFCLGLGTATYYSYAQVCDWMSPARSSSADARATLLGQKVDALTKNTNVGGVVELTAPIEAHGHTKKISHRIHEFKAAEHLAEEKTPDGSSELAKEEKKSEEGEKEKKEGDEEGKVAEKDKNDDGDAPVAQPVYIPTESSSASSSSESTAKKESPSSEQTRDLPLVGAFPVISRAPTAAPYTNPSGSTGQGGAGSSVVPPVLSATEIAMIQNTVFHASMLNDTVYYDGQECGAGGADPCNPRTHIPIHTLRWGFNSGLSQTATLAFTGSSTLELSLGLSVEKTGGPEAVNLTAPLSSAAEDAPTVTKTTNAGVQYKTIVLNFVSQTVQSGSVELTKIKATLVYQMSSNDANATGTLTADSSLSFVRTPFATLDIPFNPSNPDEASVHSVKIDNALFTVRLSP